MELYIMRHGKTTANEERIAASRMKGYYDELTSEGMEQSKKLLFKLKDYKFDAIIVSPLKRTTQTVKPYLESLRVRQKVVVLDLVTERDLGDLSGKSMDEVGKIIKSSEVNSVEWTPPNGESEIDVHLRARRFVNYLRENFGKDSKILLCSHSNFLRVLDIVLTKGDIMDFPNRQAPSNGMLKKYIFS